MVKVLGPGNIPIQQPSVASPVRSSPTSFGAPQAEALQDFGKSIAAIGGAVQRIKGEQQDATDQAFLDSYDLESDLSYGDAAQEEETNTAAGADGLTDRVRQRFETDSDGIMERVRAKGFTPSDKALAKAEAIKARRQHQYLRKTAVVENNERVRNFSTQLDNSIATIASRGVTGGDIDGALTRAEQSIEAHKGVLPPDVLDRMRERAAKHFFDNLKAGGNPDELEALTQRLMRGGAEQATPAEGAAAAAGRGGGDQPSQPATRARPSDFQIPQAERRGLPAGMRNNNPGNIKYTSRRAFAGVQGPSQNTDQGDPQAVFDTPQAGMDAAANLALRKYRGGKTSAMDLIAGRMGWTPGNSQAAANVAQTMGIGPDDDLGLDQPENMVRFLKALTLQEHGPDSRRYPDELYRHAAGASGTGAAMAQSTLRGALAREMSTRLPEITTIIDKRREQIELQTRARAIITGEEPVDPGSKADRDTMDKVIKATDIPERLGNADPQAAGQVTALVKSTGYVPDAAISQLRASAVNGTPEQKVFALETAANILREKPGAFETSDAAKALKDDATLYETLTLDAGISSQEALTRIAEMRTPEFAKRREAFKKELAEGGNKSPISQLTPGDLTAEYDGWWSSEPALGGSPGLAGVVFDAYRDLVGYHYVKSGDIEIAKAAAKKDLKRTYDVSEVTGNRRLMRHPPEFHYPRIEPRAGKEPDHSYFTQQLHAVVNEHVGGGPQAFGQANPEARATAVGGDVRTSPEIPIEDIFIETIPQTHADIRAGRLPGYAVMWREMRDGIPVLNTAPGMVFRADVKGEMERVRTNREGRLRYERLQEIETRRALEGIGAGGDEFGLQTLPGGGQPQIVTQ